MKDTSPMIPPTRVKRQVTIQEINDPPMPNTFDTTVEYPSDGLPEWFAPLQSILEDQTVDGLDIVIGGGRVRYHITLNPVAR
ncbi:MAG: hypothetical protein ACRDHW_00450 [Ktedonobacteraceae bacterium]